MTRDGYCPVCGCARRSMTSQTDDFGNRLVVDCPRCGFFRIGSYGGAQAGNRAGLQSDDVGVDQGSQGVRP